MVTLRPGAIGTMEESDGKWIVKKKTDRIPALRNPIVIEGLPGIGNVGKIAVDFLIDELKPQLICEIYSHTFPHSVFITEDNIIELPCVMVHAYKSEGERDYIFISGDVQPMDEQASYDFCTKVLDIVEKMGCKEIVTLGGIGLPTEPKNPKVYGAATDSETLKLYKNANKSIIFKENKAATIVGASGLLLGLARLRGWSGVSLLAETFGHSFHLGLKEAKATLVILKSLFNFNINLNLLEREIKKEERRALEGVDEEEKALMKKLKRLSSGERDTSYIG